MGARATSISIYVCTCTTEISNKQVHNYDPYRRIMGFFCSNIIIICFGTIYDANMEILSCQVIFYQPFHTFKTLKKIGEYRSKYKILPASRWDGGL